MIQILKSLLVLTLEEMQNISLLLFQSEPAEGSSHAYGPVLDRNATLKLYTNKLLPRVIQLLA